MRAALAALALAVPGAAPAAPPAPAPGLDYRLVLHQGATGPRIEIRKHAGEYLHTLMGSDPPSSIHYDTASGIATVLDGAEVVRLRLAPSELGGFDAEGMMAGLSETPVTWETGATRTIAGAGCTEHTGTGTRDGTKLIGRFCVTAEGILLAIATGGPGQTGRALEAETLEIGPQPAAPFDMSAYSY